MHYFRDLIKLERKEDKMRPAPGAAGFKLTYSRLVGRCSIHWATTTNLLVLAFFASIEFDSCIVLLAISWDLSEIAFCMAKFSVT